MVIDGIDLKRVARILAHLVADDARRDALGTALLLLDINGEVRTRQAWIAERLTAIRRGHVGSTYDPLTETFTVYQLRGRVVR